MVKVGGSVLRLHPQEPVPLACCLFCGQRYTARMTSATINLADPECEPTDEQFRELAQRAAIEVNAANAAALASYWAGIWRLAAEYLAKLNLPADVEVERR